MSRASPKSNSKKSFREWLLEKGVAKISGVEEGDDETVMRRLAAENKIKFNFRDEKSYQKFIGLFDKVKFANKSYRSKDLSDIKIGLADLEQLLFSYNQYLEGFNGSSPSNRGQNLLSERSSQSNAANKPLVSPKQQPQSFYPSSEVKKESSNSSVLSPEPQKKPGYDSLGKPLSVDVNSEEGSDGGT